MPIDPRMLEYFKSLDAQNSTPAPSVDTTSGLAPFNFSQMPITTPDDESSDTSSSSERVPAEAPGSTPPPQAITPQPMQNAQPDQSSVVKDYISKLLGNDPRVQALQDQSRQDQGLALMAEAAARAGHALSRSPAPFDASGYQQLQALAGQPLKDYLTQQQLQGEKLKQAGELQKEFVNEPEKVKEQTELRKEEMKTRQLQQQFMNEQRMQQRQNQNFAQTSQLLESARGNQAAQQAEKDIYASNKVDSLIGKDPNSLSPQMVQLLASEVSKIANGGTPSIEELRGLNAGTFPGGLATLAQKVVNHPIGADAGAFVRQFQQYAHSIRNDAQKVIQDRYGRIIESRKSLLTPDETQALKTQYLERFKSSNNVDSSDPRVQQALSHGYTMDEIKDYLNGKH